MKPLNKVILVGDPHFGAYNNSKEWLNNFKEFYYKILIPRVRSIPAKERDQWTVIFTGDIFDKKQVINTLVLNVVIDIFAELSVYVDVHSILGNHDAPRKMDRDINNCKALSHINDVYIHVDPCVIDTVRGEKMLLLPWVSREDDFEIETKLIEAHPDCQYLIHHTEIEGFTYEYKVISGDCLSRSSLDGFKRVYGGHVHNQQEEDHIIYVGPPYHVRAVEYKNPIGYFEIDFDVDGMPQETYIENKISPKHKRIHLETLMNMEVAEANRFVKNSYVKVMVAGSDLMAYNIDAVFKLLKGHKRLEILPVVPKIDTSAPVDDRYVSMEELDKTINSIDIKDNIRPFVNSLPVIKLSKKEVISINDKDKSIIIQILEDSYNTIK